MRRRRGGSFGGVGLDRGGVRIMNSASPHLRVENVFLVRQHRPRQSTQGLSVTTQLRQVFLSQATESLGVFFAALVDQAGDLHTEFLVRDALGNQVFGTAGKFTAAGLIVIKGRDAEERDQSPIAGALVEQSPPVGMAGCEVEEYGIRWVFTEHLLGLGEGGGSFDINTRRGNLCHSPGQKFGSIYYKKSGHTFPRTKSLQFLFPGGGRTQEDINAEARRRGGAEGFLSAGSGVRLHTPCAPTGRLWARQASFPRPSPTFRLRASPFVGGPV